MNIESTLLRISLAILTLNVSAPAALFSVNPIADAFVSSANPDSNYGGAGALAVAAAALPKGEFDSLLKFDLAAAKASFDTAFGAGLWSIQSVTLQFTAAVPNNPIFNGNAAGPGGTHLNFAGQYSIRWMQNDAWTEGNGGPSGPSTEGGIVQATLPSFLSAADEALGTFAFSGATSGSSTAALSLAPAFLADASAGNTLSLRLLPADDGVAFVFNSRASAIVGNRPLLTLNAGAVPEPGTAALLAGAAFAGLARRRGRALREC